MPVDVQVPDFTILDNVTAISNATEKTVNKMDNPPPTDPGYFYTCYTALPPENYLLKGYPSILAIPKSMFRRDQLYTYKTTSSGQVSLPTIRKLIC